MLLGTLRDFNVSPSDSHDLSLSLDSVWDSFVLAEGLQKEDTKLEQMVHPSVAELYWQPRGRLDTEGALMAFCSVCCKS